MPSASVVGQADSQTKQLLRVRAIAAAALLLAAALALPGCSKPAGAANASQAQLPTVTVAAPTSAVVQDLRASCCDFPGSRASSASPTRATKRPCECRSGWG